NVTIRLPSNLSRGERRHPSARTTPPQLPVSIQSPAHEGAPSTVARRPPPHSLLDHERSIATLEGPPATPCRCPGSTSVHRRRMPSICPARAHRGACLSPDRA